MAGLDKKLKGLFRKKPKAQGAVLGHSDPATNTTPENPIGKVKGLFRKSNSNSKRQPQSQMTSSSYGRNTVATIPGQENRNQNIHSIVSQGLRAGPDRSDLSSKLAPRLQTTGDGYYYTPATAISNSQNESRNTRRTETQPLATQPHDSTQFLGDVAQFGTLSDAQTLLARKRATDKIEVQQCLMRAVNRQDKNTDILLLLLQQDYVDVNWMNESGSTALHRAVSCGHGKAIRILLEHGADPFLGSPSSLEVAESVMEPCQLLTLFRERVDTLFPGRRENFLQQRRARQAYRQRYLYNGPQERLYNVSSRDRLPWRDQVFYHRGEGETRSASDPSYWN